MRMLFSVALACTLMVDWVVLEGAVTIHNGRIINVSLLPVSSEEEHYQGAIEALNSRRFEEVIRNFDILTYHFPESPYVKDATYYKGLAYLGRREFRRANEYLTTYMKTVSRAHFFREAVEAKFRIARELSVTNSFFNDETALALEIYDELIAVFPQDEIAAKALFDKAMLQWEMDDFQASIVTFQDVIKRFPKHELSPESYVAIAEVYYGQSLQEKEKFDALALAKINLAHFQADFPQEERIQDVVDYCRKIAELYASSMWKIAAFYERIDKPKASVIYYQRIIHLFPETAFAGQSRRRLQKLCPQALEQMQDHAVS